MLYIGVHTHSTICKIKIDTHGAKTGNYYN